MSEDVNALVARVKSGDDDAFAELCSRYSKLVASSAARYSGCGTEYGASDDDFRQEASMALYRAAKSYDDTQSAVTFGLYAKTCIRNALVSQLRKLRTRARGADRRSAQAEISAEQTVMTEETRRLYMKRIDGVLSPFEARVLMMTMEGHRPRHIARELGSSAKAVSNALFRARVKLRNEPQER